MTTPDTGYLRFAMYNGSIVATDALKVSPLGAGFMAGEGVFETVRMRNSRPLLFDAHHARLAASIRCLDAAPSIVRGELHDRCTRVIEANALPDGSLKIVVFREVTGWSEIILARAPAYAAARYEAGFRLRTIACDLRVDPIHALKSLNYLPNIRAKRIALTNGFDEALFVDPRRHVLEGATTNVFIVKDRAVRTPSLTGGILPGVMRACVIEMLGSPGIRECDVTLDDLLRADEVFVTNALLGIMPVNRVDATAYTLGRNRNTITRSLMAALAARLGAI